VTSDAPAGARLAVFDVDGTLTATNAVDDDCFCRAMSTALGVEIPDVNFAAAVHATDSYITRALCERHLGRAPTAADLDRLTSCFVAELTDELGRAPERFAPIPGAPGLFDALRAKGWSIAIATGGWGPSARLKLAAAGLDDPELVLACAGDALTRPEIVRRAIDRAVARAGHGFARTVSIGDRPWDAWTAAALGLPFVGVGVGRKEDEMRAAGAAIVLPDLRDREQVCTALETASSPGA